MLRERESSERRIRGERRRGRNGAAVSDKTAYDGDQRTSLSAMTTLEKLVFWSRPHNDHHVCQTEEKGKSCAKVPIDEEDRNNTVPIGELDIPKSQRIGVKCISVSKDLRACRLWWISYCTVCPIWTNTKVGVTCGYPDNLDEPRFKTRWDTLQS